MDRHGIFFDKGYDLWINMEIQEYKVVISVCKMPKAFCCFEETRRPHDSAWDLYVTPNRPTSNFQMRFRMG